MPSRVIKQMASTPLGWRALQAARPPAVTVLTYHRIVTHGQHFPGLPVEHFTAQMRWLKRNCRVIRPDEFAAVLARPPRHRPAVMVTFDDGYRDYHDVAYPILAELDIPAIVFIPTALIGSTGLIWTDAVHCAVWFARTASFTIPWTGEQRAVPQDAPSKLALSEELKRALKAMSEEERGERLKSLFASLGVADPSACVDRQLMTWEEVRATMPLTQYGGHSHGHSILSSLSDEALQQDLATCREVLEQQLGTRTPFFAYPNGTAADFDERTRRVLRDNGFKLAFTTLAGRNNRLSDPYALRRQPTQALKVRDYAWLVGALGASG